MTENNTIYIEIPPEKPIYAQTLKTLSFNDVDYTPPILDTSMGWGDRLAGFWCTPSAKEYDQLLSSGELVTSALLSIALNELGYPSISMSGANAGITTNNTYNFARIEEIDTQNITDAISDGKIVVVAGFQGVSFKKEVTTLGRGGSDISAVALASALNADRCEIYSDVDGVFSTDPTLVKNVKKIQSLEQIIGHVQRKME
jgi:aspartate kinase